MKIKATDILKLLIVAAIIFLFMFGVIYTSQYFSYERSELRAFNNINETSYTLEEWRIYSFDIRELYPLPENLRSPE